MRARAAPADSGGHRHRRLPADRGGTLPCRQPGSATVVSSLRIRYLDGRGVLRRLLQVLTSQGFTVDEVSTDTAGRCSATRTGPGAQGVSSLSSRSCSRFTAGSRSTTSRPRFPTSTMSTPSMSSLQRAQPGSCLASADDLPETQGSAPLAVQDGRDYSREMMMSMNPTVAVAGPRAIGTTVTAALHEVGPTPRICCRTAPDSYPFRKSTSKPGANFLTGKMARLGDVELSAYKAAVHEHGSSGPSRSVLINPWRTVQTSPTTDWFGENGHAGRVGESAKAEAAEVSAEFEGLEDVAPDSGGEEFGDDGGADGG
jgi:hypothetical protein